VFKSGKVMGEGFGSKQAMACLCHLQNCMCKVQSLCSNKD
jgi:hypothetical protein